jgi:multiple sugar transport system ATP-binding protein
MSGEGMPMEIVVVEPTGSETQVVARANNTEITCLFRDRITARPGEIIRVMPDVQKLHLFDNDAGLRLN